MSSDDAILFSNNLTYKLPTPTSVVSNRVRKRNYFQNRSYTQGQTMVCTLNTGADFIDLNNSSLVVKIKVTSTNVNPFDCQFVSGSALNVFENMRAYHRSGTQLTNTQKLNMWRVKEDHNVKNENWFLTIGQSIGYLGTQGQITSTDPVFTAVIPLKCLHPLFDPENDVMMPASLASGMRVELDLEGNIGQVVKDNGVLNTDPPTAFEIEDIYFDLMNITLMDSAQASLNTKAQKNALEYLYKDIFTSRSSTPSNSSTINIDVNKAVSYCDKVYGLITPNALANDINADSFDTPYVAGSWWYSLGSNQYPSNQKIDSSKLAYNSNLLAFDKLKSRIGYGGETNVTLGEFNSTHGLYAVSLERDTALQLSQLPVTSSRTLRFELVLDNPLASDSTTIIFMTYLTSCRVTLTSCRVDI